MKPVKNNLVALGSAAVFTVYAAGFLRTKSAADRFVGEDADRGRVAATREHDPGAAPALPLAAIPPVRDSLAAPEREPLEITKRPAPPIAMVAAKSVVDSPVTTHPTAPDSVATSLVAVPPPAPVIPVQTAAVDSQAVDSSSQKKEAQLKDGIYSGWGTSRHGDIQAAVEIREGRIISASITQCLTRYSCSWISSLPPQVLSRQGPNVDYISGATQSSNAFYYAIVEALSKAK